MNFVQKTWSDLNRDQNYRYFFGFFTRIKENGTIETIKELHQYNKKFVWLPRKIGKRGDLRYTLFVLYNYFKIIFIFPKIEKERLLNIFPTRFQQFFLFDLDPKEEKVVTYNKLLFYKKMKNDLLPFPNTFGYSKNGKLYNIDDVPISKEEIAKMPERLFIKPYESNGGNYAKIIERNEISSLTDGMLFQEVQDNHPDIIKLSGRFAFNTVRIITYLDYKNNLQILSAIFRISKGKEVDNWGKGSINVEVDIEKGTLIGKGITKYQESYDRFPSTGVVLDGFQMPMWDEFLKLVNNAAYAFKNLRLIAWDIGFSERGPVVIEANSGCDFFHAQLFHPYYQTPLIQDLLEKCNAN